MQNTFEIMLNNVRLLTILFQIIWTLAILALQEQVNFPEVVQVLKHTQQDKNTAIYTENRKHQKINKRNID